MDTEAPDEAALLASADAARDARDWIAAAAGYAAYLRLRPDDWAIYVQHGHAQKEAGDPATALALYRQAERLQPRDADLHLQIGHALKLLGRLEEAYQAYAQALSLDPDNPAARAEFALGAELLDPPTLPRAPAESAPADPAPATTSDVLLDVSDLLDYARHNRAPTGIQRVQLGIAEAALAAGRAIAVAFDADRGLWTALPPGRLAALGALARVDADPADPAWMAALAACHGGPAAGLAGATLVTLGTAWWLPDYLRRIRAARRAHGLRYAAFLHDCIPLVVPEHCEARLVEEFARWFAALCDEADLFLCNSRCTERDARRLAAAIVPAVPPSAVIPLNAAFPTLPGPADVAPARPYVLFVGTIESRKDHKLAFQAWLALLRTHGADRVPDLVCVGKRGWLAEPALALLAGSPELQGRVRLLHGVADATLAALYAGARFTLYNSAYEGWGLPVTESLAHGKVPLVPDHSSLREAGGTAAEYFAPGSLPSLVAALERLLFDAGALAAAEVRVAREAGLRDWSSIAAQLLDAVAAPRPPRGPPLRLRAGAVQRTALLPGPLATPAMALADAVRDGPGWSRLEPWGVWSGPGESRLHLPLEPVPGPLRLHLALRGPTLPHRTGLRAGWDAVPSGPFRPLETGAGEVVFAAIDVEPAPPNASALLVEFDNGEGVASPGAPRRLGLGVAALMVCAPDDFAARLDWLEAFALTRSVAL